MKRTAEQVVQEWRDSGSQDWGQLVSAVNYWAMTDMCPELNAPRPTSETETVLRLREALERRCNYFFGGYDGGNRCQKAKGHDGAHLWESDAEELLRSASSQVVALAEPRKGGGE